MPNPQQKKDSKSDTMVTILFPQNNVKTKQKGKISCNEPTIGKTNNKAKQELKDFKTA